MSTPSIDIDETYTRLLIVRTTRDAAQDRFARAGVLATDWAEADTAAPATNSGDLYADLGSDQFFDRTSCQVALATVGSLVQRSIRDFVA